MGTNLKVTAICAGVTGIRTEGFQARVPYSSQSFHSAIAVGGGKAAFA
jgi:hypothetical protein